ncbi:hypothetical protein A6U85_11285 [Agrobacterium sp. 13-626]|nr:hypothetical protein CN09_26935 [Rhizobium rhizogenes]MQB31216.1 hypothetical protein [Rhizobium rhizogenes]OCJ02205.1 hypothetical protein A6U85_11285 [Agrobacterium sp. 13-626]OCJ15655.1 hypothetical protein A6U89_20690 [Agrobacterium sp. B133/95]
MSSLFCAIIRFRRIFLQALQDAFRAPNDTSSARKPCPALVGSLLHIKALLFQGALTPTKLLEFRLHHGRLPY